MTNLVGLAIVLFGVWNIFGFIALLVIPYSRDAEIIEIFSPKHIYKNIKINWFGCLILTLFFNLLCPVFTVGWWFYWLCTVGRRTDE